MRRRVSVQKAFDEVRFGPTRMLNLRNGLPSGAQAVQRAEGWLRAKQIELAGEVLIVTGRGHGSLGGVPVIKAEVQRLLSRLRRNGVVAGVREHTAGSVVVTLAPLRALFEGIARHKDRRAVSALPPSAPAFEALEPATLKTCQCQNSEHSSPTRVMVCARFMSIKQVGTSVSPPGSSLWL